VAGRGRAGFGARGVVGEADLPGGRPVGVGLVVVRRCWAARIAAAARAARCWDSRSSATASARAASPRPGRRRRVRGRLDPHHPGRARLARDIIAALVGLGIHAEAVTTRKPTLDDVYLQLTGSRLAA
jgi:hypothetical protein